MSPTLRAASRTEIPEIMLSLAQGREAQRRQGFTQWADAYPPQQAVETDIRLGRGYLFEVSGVVAAYVALACEDSEYERLSAIWHHQGPYGTIHRLAIADGFRGRGLAASVLALAEDRLKSLGVSSVRVDTGEENAVMQRVLTRAQYVSRGLHAFVWGPRIAFEKPL